MLVPFFIYALWSDERRWPRRCSVRSVASALAGGLPIASTRLERGARGWALGADGPARGGPHRALARMRQYAVRWVASSMRLTSCGSSSRDAAVIVLSSPLWATISLRVETPHSNERRLTVADVVIGHDLGGVPAARLRHAPARSQGSFSSIAGGGEPQLSPVRRATSRDPGLHVAAGVHHGLRRDRTCLAFLAVQFFAHCPRRNPVILAGVHRPWSRPGSSSSSTTRSRPRCSSLMLAIGLMNRERLSLEGESLRRRMTSALAHDSRGGQP